MIYFTNETGSCETTVQLLQNVHGVDIAHDNVCSSMLSCFFSYVAATVNRASYFWLNICSEYFSSKPFCCHHCMFVPYGPDINLSSVVSIKLMSDTLYNVLSEVVGNNYNKKFHKKQKHNKCWENMVLK